MNYYLCNCGSTQKNIKKQTHDIPMQNHQALLFCILYLVKYKNLGLKQHISVYIFLKCTELALKAGVDFVHFKS